MAKYIDADKLIGQMLLEKSAYENRLSVMKAENMRNMPIEINLRSSIDELGRCVNMVKQTPTADVAKVRHGEWSHLGGDEWCCTNCGGIITTEGSWVHPTKRYCNECGAVMDGGEEG